jgi:integrase
VDRQGTEDQDATRAKKTYPVDPREEAERLFAELPEHLRALATFSVETGLRKSNVTGVQWSQVDLRRRCAWIRPDQARGRRAIAVPLSEAAILVLREQVGKHPLCVFTYRGDPIKQLNSKAWRAAFERAGIEDFRWHDLRHTWASWHVQAGTPLHVLQELGGWESVEMVRRYAHLSSDHLVEYVDRISGSLKVVNESKGVMNQLRVAECSGLASSQATDLMAPGGTRTPDHLVRSHNDQFKISNRTVTCDAYRIRKPDVTR